MGEVLPEKEISNTSDLRINIKNIFNDLNSSLDKASVYSESKNQNEIKKLKSILSDRYKNTLEKVPDMIVILDKDLSWGRRVEVIKTFKFIFADQSREVRIYIGFLLSICLVLSCLRSLSGMSKDELPSKGVRLIEVARNLMNILNKPDILEWPEE